MKRCLLILTVLVIFGAHAFCQEAVEEVEDVEASAEVPEVEETVIELVEIPVEDEPPAPNRIRFTFDEGVSFAQVTRVERLTDRSNFVRENMMIGPYFTVKALGMPVADLQLDVSAYYPLYQAFNGMQQQPRNVLNYAVDTYLAVNLTIDKFKYVLITGSMGMHYMYQLTDEWHMNYLGLGISGGLEFPISAGWTIVNRNYFSYDNANLGSNKTIQPFYASYQYHINLGVRYSRRVRNEYSYIK